MAADFRLGIQSYCFRTFKTLPELIEALSAVGLKYVEIWPGHQDPGADEAELRTVLNTLAANGITMDSFGLATFTADEAPARKVLEFCKMAGVKAVTADVRGDDLDAAIANAERLAEEFDINLAIHNHGRKHQWGHPDQLDELFARTSKRIGLCLDTAWMLDCGIDPLDALGKYADRLYGVHLKDFIFDADGNHEDVIIGTGGLDLPELMRRLNAMNFDGYMSLEYEGEVDAPLPNVITCLEAIQDTIAAL
jgi:sugar phosphate isomerase/epimerase